MSADYFVNRTSIDLATELKASLDRLATTAEPLEKAGAVAITLTRCLGEIERNPGIDKATQEQWVRDYAAFLLGRFGGIEL